MLEMVDARLVRPEWASAVVSPASEAMTAADRRRYMADHPDSFLHVTRARPGEGRAERTPEELARENAAHLQRLIDAGAFTRPDPGLYLYRLEAGDHAQTAVVAEIPLSAYDAGLVRPHERTRTDREEHLALHLRMVGAVSAPVTMTHRWLPDLAPLVESVTATEPLLAFTGNRGLQQTVWRVPSATAHRLVGVFEDQPLYVADGHHRLAAALRLREDIERVGAASGPAGDHVFSAIFPAHELRTMAFHRVVETARSPGELVAALREISVVTEVAGPEAATPPGPGRFGLHHGGRWWTIEPFRTDIALDVVWLQDEVLAAVLGIVSPRTDHRLAHIPATAGVTPLVEAARAQRAVFLLAPTPTEAVIEAADRREILPPKSSFFTPKPRAGVFVVERHVAA